MVRDTGDPGGPNYGNWPVESDEGTEYLGLAGAGSPMLYEPSTDRVYEGRIDDENERLVPKPDTERELDPEETLGEALEDIGEATGWDSLSSFADDHLTDENS